MLNLFHAIQAETEQETEGPPAALPREQRLGFAIVEPGRLTLEEIMPVVNANWLSCSILARF